MDAENYRDTFHSGWTPYGTAESSRSWHIKGISSETADGLCQDQINFFFPAFRKMNTVK